MNRLQLLERCDAEMEACIRAAISNKDVQVMQGMRKAATEWALCSAGLRAFIARDGK